MRLAATGNQQSLAGLEPVAGHVIDGLQFCRADIEAAGDGADAVAAANGVLIPLHAFISGHAGECLAEAVGLGNRNQQTMRAKGIGEDEAYALMRKAAMDQGKKLAEVAQALVTAAELLK